MSDPAARQRYAEALEHRRAGKTYREIGELMSNRDTGQPVTRARAHQLVRKAERIENMRRITGGVSE